MSGKDSSDSTNLPLFEVGRSKRVVVAGEDNAKNKDAAAFRLLMAKMTEEAKPITHIFGRGALDHDDMLYLKETNQAEEDANRMREHNERKAFAAFKAAACQVDAAPSSPSALGSPKALFQPKRRSSIRQEVLLRTRVEVKAKRPKIELLARSRTKDKESLEQGASSEASQERSGAGVQLCRSESAISDAGTPKACPEGATESCSAGLLEETQGTLDRAANGASDLASSASRHCSTAEGEGKEGEGTATRQQDRVAALGGSSSSQGLVTLGLAYGNSDSESEG